tara:strand:+ start:155 stop:754 length:600 start_codon:yes stop_codon:yes gene_type:complete
MWAKLNSGGDTIEEIIVNMKGMSVDGINHPKALFTLWTDAERLAIGIVPVTTSGSHLDTTYYIEKDPTYTIASDKSSVIRTIGVKDVDKDLEDVNEVDENGIQNIIRGLKYNAIQNIKEQQSEYLTKTDWYIIRKADNGTAIPSNIQTWRDAIRSDATRIENAITAAVTMDQFIALHTTTYNEDETVDQIATTQSWTEE